MSKTRLLVIVGCHGDQAKSIQPCSFRTIEHTPGSGYADDYRCSAVRSKEAFGEYALIDGYVEFPSEKRKPGDFPKFCPLPHNRGYKARGKAGQ